MCLGGHFIHSGTALPAAMYPYLLVVAFWAFENPASAFQLWFTCLTRTDRWIDTTGLVVPWKADCTGWIVVPTGGAGYLVTPPWKNSRFTSGAATALILSEFIIKSADWAGEVWLLTRFAIETTRWAPWLGRYTCYNGDHLISVRKIDWKFMFWVTIISGKLSRNGGGGKGKRCRRRTAD